MGLGPFDLHGPEFLALYGVLGAIALVACLAIPPWLRPGGRPGRAADDDELAILAGGRDRFGEAVTTSLLAAGALTVEKQGLWIRDPRAGRTLAERRIVALSSPVTWQGVTKALAGPAATLEAKLEARGLMIDAATALSLRLWQTAPLALLFAFGAVKWVVGTMRERPVGFLTVLLVVTLIAAVIRFAKIDRRTRAGQQAVRDARLDNARLRRATTTDESPRAVALFGTAVLAGSYLSDFHRYRAASSGDGSSGSDGGGSGGCGGGCGGCGS